MRKIRRFVVPGVMALVGLAAGLVGGHLLQPPPAQSQGKARSIATEEIAILGPEGNPRILINARDDTPAIYFYDAAGKPQLVLSVTKGGTVINVNNRKGESRILLGVTEKEGSGALLLKDAEGKVVYRQPPLPGK